MTEIRHRFVGDKVAYDFAVLIGGTPTPIPSATLEAALLDPSGQVLAAAAAWLPNPDDNVVRVTVADDTTTAPGRHELQLRISDGSLAEPVRARVFLDLLSSAV